MQGILPDITTLGKIVGGGLPIGAYGGRKDIMDHVLPAGKVYQAGTLSGNPVATAAGSAILKLLRDEPPYQRLDDLGEQLETGLGKVAAAAGFDHRIARVGSMMTFFFSKQDVRSWNEAADCDTELFGKYFWGLMDRGVYMPCSQYEALFISAAHTEADIQATIDAASATFTAISAA